MKKYESKFKEEKLLEEGYKGTFKDTTIEISNIDRAFGKLIADEIANFAKHKIEDGTNLKLYKITLDLK